MPELDKLYEAEMEALFQFCRAHNLQKKYTLEGTDLSPSAGLDPYTNDWRKHYMMLKKQRLQREAAKVTSGDGSPTS